MKDIANGWEGGKSKVSLFFPWLEVFTVHAHAAMCILKLRRLIVLWSIQWAISYYCCICSPLGACLHVNLIYYYKCRTKLSKSYAYNIACIFTWLSWLLLWYGVTQRLCYFCLLSVEHTAFKLIKQFLVTSVNFGQFCALLSMVITFKQIVQKHSILYKLSSITWLTQMLHAQQNVSKSNIVFKHPVLCHSRA